MKAIAIDPGLGAFGWSLIKIGDSPIEDIVLKLGTLVTKPTKEKHAVYTKDDMQQRLDLLITETMNLIAEDPVLIVSESWSPVRNASAASKLAMSCAMVQSLARAYQIGFYTVLPQQVKHSLLSVRSGSKQSIADAVFGRITFTDEARAMIVPLRKKAEHAIDSVAIWVAFSTSNPIQVLRTSLRKK